MLFNTAIFIRIQVKIIPYEIFEKEIKIIGSFAQTHCYDRALKYLESGRVQVNRLITQTFPLSEYAKGLDKVIEGGKQIKVLIHPDK